MVTPCGLLLGYKLNRIYPSLRDFNKFSATKMPKSKLFYGKRRRFTGNQHTGPITRPTKQPRGVKIRRSLHQYDQTVERGSYRGESAVSGFELRNVTEGYVFKLTPGETSQKCLHLKYCPASDKYIRISNDSQQTKDYRTCVYQSQNMYRKEEYDWNMVYIARDQGDTPGHIAWRFDLKESGLVVESITIAVAAKTYQNGRVVWKVFADGRPPKELPVHEEIQFTTITAPVSGEDTVNLSADLMGGTGDVAYQHAQLFRIGLEDYDRYPLDIMIRLKAK